MKVDAILLTKDCISERWNRLVFYNCLLSLATNVSVEKLIVVDGGSKDGTLEFISKLNKNLSLFPHIHFINDTGGTRATARMKGIKNVETEWFVFVDSDCVLCHGWFKKAFKHTSSGVGAIEGKQKLILNFKDTRFFEARKILTRKLNRLARRNVRFEEEGRGFTGDTLIKTDLLKDIEIPSYYHVFEDYYIKRWIEKKGYKWIRIDDAYCYHFCRCFRPRDVFCGSYILTKEDKLTLKHEMLRVLTAFPRYVLIGYPDCGLREFKLSLYRFSAACKGKLYKQQSQKRVE